jgi:hypothetical protein
MAAEDNAKPTPKKKKPTPKKNRKTRVLLTHEQKLDIVVERQFVINMVCTTTQWVNGRRTGTTLGNKLRRNGRIRSRHLLMMD